LTQLGQGRNLLPRLIMVTLIFKLLLLLTPIVVGTNVNGEMFDIIFFRLGSMALFAATFIDHPRRVILRDVKILLFSFIALCFANIFLTTFQPTVLHVTLNIFLAIVDIAILYQYLDPKSIWKYILVAAAINLVMFISQRLGFDPVFDIKTNIGEEGGFMGNKQRLVTYLALITPFLFAWLWFVPVIIGLYTKQYVIFIPLLFMLKGKWRVLAVISTLAFYKHIWTSLCFRFPFWKEALTMFFDKPLLGHGLGIRLANTPTVGSDFLEISVGVGIIGLSILGYFIYKYRKTFTPAVLTLFSVMLIEYVFAIGRIWMTVIGIIVLWLLTKGEGDYESC
jgi:hypothetical protein